MSYRYEPLAILHSENDKKCSQGTVELVEKENKRQIEHVFHCGTSAPLVQSEIARVLCLNRYEQVQQSWDLQQLNFQKTLIKCFICSKSNHCKLHWIFQSPRFRTQWNRNVLWPPRWIPSTLWTVYNCLLIHLNLIPSLTVYLYLN